MIGLSIIRVALPLLFGMEQDETTIDRTALAVGLISLATMIAMTIVSTGHIRLYATIAGLLVGYLAAIVLGVIDAAFLENLRDLPWFGLPAAPALDLDFSPILIVPFLIATIASNIEEEHTSELQSLMRISYAVFCLNKKT